MNRGRWHAAWLRLKALGKRQSLAQELDEEVSFHLAMRADRNRLNGMRADEAAYAARRHFGNTTLTKERAREMWVFGSLEDFSHDLRFGVRMLGKNFSFTLVAILTLALGIGANTAIFSVIHSVLLSALPYRDSDRLVVVWEHNRRLNHETNTVGPANFFTWQERNSVFEQIGFLYDDSVSLTRDGLPEEVPAQAVSANLLLILGTPPAMGRVFSDEDAQPGHDDVVVLSHGLWQRRFGGDLNIVGKTIRLDGQNNIVIGVMPPGFDLFIKRGSLSQSGAKPQLWEVITPPPSWREPHGRFLTAVGRLKTGVSVTQAQAQMNSLAAALEKQWPDFDTGWGVNLVPLQDELRGDLRRPLWILFGAVGLVLLIACANVASLLLARGAARQKEWALRSALGASRSRLARQLITECLCLALAGGIAGLLLALWGTRVLLLLAPKGLMGATVVNADPRILLFVLAASILTALLFGVVPALAAIGTDVNETLKEGGRTSQSRGRTRLRKVFVVAEVALAFVLLVGSGLLARSFQRLTAVDPGFHSGNLLAVQLSLPFSRYKAETQRVNFFRETRDRFAAIPGVREAGGNSFLPFTGLASATDIQVVGRPAPLPGQSPGADVRMIEPGYFQAMGIPLIEGRLFTEEEFIKPTGVVIVSESLARHNFPGEDPIGKSIVIDMKDQNTPSRIVGVVGDVKHYGLETTAPATAYWPHVELAIGLMTFVLRCDGDPRQLISPVRQVVAAMDPELPVTRIVSMNELLADSVARERFNAALLSIFGGAALVLALVGVYGLMAYSVSQQTQEFGIRMALGSPAQRVLKMVLLQGMRLSVIGIAIGISAGLASTRLLTGLLFNLQPNDPAVFILVAAALAAAATGACLIPAYRATRVDPVIALRHE
jgi:putative ABC transport system permease protein